MPSQVRTDCLANLTAEMQKVVLASKVSTSELVKAVEALGATGGSRDNLASGHILNAIKSLEATIAKKADYNTTPFTETL